MLVAGAMPAKPVRPAGGGRRRAGGGRPATGAGSARHTLRLALSVLLRLFAPFLPYASEEVWSWWHGSESVHREPWPSIAELGRVTGTTDVLTAASGLLGDIRRAKTEAGASLRAQVASLSVSGSDDHLAILRDAEDDIREAGVVAVIEWSAGDTAGVQVTLA